MSNRLTKVILFDNFSSVSQLSPRTEPKVYRMQWQTILCKTHQNTIFCYNKHFLRKILLQILYNILICLKIK